MRRTLIIIAAVVVLAGIGAAGYFYFFNNTADVAVIPNATNGEGLPIIDETAPVTEVGETSTTTIISPNTPVQGAAARLVKISEGPVVPGAIVVNKKAAASSTAETRVNYVERQSGNVYSYVTDTTARTRTSNKTVPGIQSASWLPDGSTAFVRYLSGENFSTVNTYALPATGSGGFFLSQNLSDIAVSEAGILTLSSGVNGSVASLSRIDGTRPSEIFTTSLSSLRVSFAGKNQYLAFTKPSARLDGSAFLVDSSGRFSRIAGPLSGLVAKASPSGKWALVSHTSGGTMRMNLIQAATGESIPLPVATIADKCVWAADDSVIYCGIPVSPSPNFNYPDDWYQGAAHFSDRIWKIDVAGRYAQFVLDFEKEDRGSLDATALAIDSLNTVLVFVNKNDGSLWSYSL
ncbi:hypothetical protein HYT04_00740 [Candidatus Kaiserbacteria bacterium]|nr:hypothetical protein [Candidatus Kaiserbacteria bacterium]